MNQPATRRCPVVGCDRQVSKKYLMCWGHWRTVPAHIGVAVYREYHNGLRHDTHPTVAYGKAICAAVEAANASAAASSEPAPEESIQ